mgnify:CR=1 FL=1
MKLFTHRVAVSFLLVSGLAFVGGVLWHQQGPATVSDVSATSEDGFAPKRNDVDEMRALGASDVCYTEFPERNASAPIFLSRGKEIKPGDHMKILRPETVQGDFELVDVRSGHFGGSAIGRGPNGEIGISFFDVVVDGRPNIMLWTDGEAGKFGWGCVSQFELEERMQPEQAS